MFKCQFLSVDSEFYYYQIEFCGIPQMKGKLGWKDGQVYHYYWFLKHKIHKLDLKEIMTIMKQVEDGYCEQGINLLAIASEQRLNQINI
jgi:hypothetical protein